MSATHGESSIGGELTLDSIQAALDELRANSPAIAWREIEVAHRSHTHPLVELLMRSAMDGVAGFTEGLRLRLNQHVPAAVGVLRGTRFDGSPVIGVFSLGSPFLPVLVYDDPGELGAAWAANPFGRAADPSGSS